MSLFFQASFNQGSIPDEWKEANVVPIFKKGDKSKAVIYRPVSLIVVLCKVMEHNMAFANEDLAKVNSSLPSKI
jgi:hypothetical protein